MGLNNNLILNYGLINNTNDIMDAQKMDFNKVGNIRWFDILLLLFPRLICQKIGDIGVIFLQNNRRVRIIWYVITNPKGEIDDKVEL